jgi:betaine-aldehyde dehydrogenase
MRAQPKGSHFIHGNFVEDSQGQMFTLTYPASGEIIAELSCASTNLASCARFVPH